MGKIRKNGFLWGSGKSRSSAQDNCVRRYTVGLLPPWTEEEGKGEKERVNVIYTFLQQAISAPIGLSCSVPGRPLRSPFGAACAEARALPRGVRARI